MKNRILILGSTSGIGRAVAARLAAEGRDLVLAARDEKENRNTTVDLRLRHQCNAQTIAFEALDFASHAEFFRKCVADAPEELGGVILCYGMLAAQQEAQSDFAIARAMLDTNYTSAVSILNIAADYFAARGKGFICAVSSVAGDRGRQSNYLYGSSKAALNTYLQGLRVRLAKSGVSVIIIKPGFVDTAMTWGLEGMFLVASPQKVAAAIVKGIRGGRGVVYTPWFWRGIMAIIKIIPDCLFKHLKM